MRAQNPRRISAHGLSLGEIAAEGPPEVFAGDLHEQVKGWLGINF